MSLAGFRPASSMAWIAPMAMSSLCAYSTLIFLPSAFRKASITSLPLARVKSPVCERMILKRGSALMISSKPFLRSMAGAEPTVPCSSTMLTSPVVLLHVLDQPAAGLAAFLDEVRAHEGDPQRVVLHVDGAVGQDDRDLRGLGFPQHGVPAGLDHRREGDHVHLLRDEGADRLDLVFLLLLRVGELQLDAGLLGGRLDRLGVGGAPFALGADLAEAQHDRFLRPGPEAGSSAGEGRDRQVRQVEGATVSVFMLVSLVLNSNEQLSW